MNPPKRVFQIHPNYKSAEKQLLQCIDSFNKRGEDIRGGDRNTIKRFVVNDEKINIKSFKEPNAFNAFIYKYIRKSKAKRSFEYANILQRSNILTPIPIAYIEAFTAVGLEKSYYISEHIDYNFDFRVLIHQPKFPERLRILQEFTEFTFRLHENGINFLDHSPGNTLITKNKGQYQFYLIDLNRMRFETMDFNKRMHNFRRLWLSKAMIKVMAETYAKLYNRTYQETYELMLKHSRAFQKKIDSKKLRRSGRRLKFKT